MKKSKANNRSTYENVQLQALAAVEDPDIEYNVRKIQRTFSTTFYVSIVETEDLTVEYMLQHIYEFKYENMKQSDRIKEAQELMRTSEEKEADLKAELRELDEDDVYMFQESQREKVRTKLKQQKKKPASPTPTKDDLPPDGKIDF